MSKCTLLTTDQPILLRVLLLFSPGLFSACNDIVISSGYSSSASDYLLPLFCCSPCDTISACRNMRKLNLHTSCNSNLFPSNRNGACWSAALPTVWRRVTACVLVIQCRTSADVYDDDDDVVLQTPEMKYSVKWGRSMRMWSFIGVWFFTVCW